MKLNAWTVGLIGAGLVSLPAVMQAEEHTNAVLSALSSTTISGYVDTSAQWNMGTGDLYVPAYAFNQGKADGFNLNVVKLSIEKPLEPTDSWGAGYKVDLIAGPDASIFNTASPLSSGGSADFGVRQAYVALRAPVGNGLDFKVGVFDTPIGYEVFDAGNNPNYTRSYGYTIEPTTHTGVLASYQFCDSFAASVGIADTVGPSINQRAFPAKAESYKTYMGSMTFTAPKSWGWLAGSTLSGVVINGFNGGTTTAPSAFDQTSWYVGASLNTPVNGLKVGASYDYLGVSKQPLTLDTSSYANATALYVSYALTEKLTVYGRGEYATTDIGTAPTALLGGNKVLALTGTLQYDLWKNVVSRLEFRWDHSLSGENIYGGVNPGDAPTKKNSYILAANIVYKF